MSSKNFEFWCRVLKRQYDIYYRHVIPNVKRAKKETFVQLLKRLSFFARLSNLEYREKQLKRILKEAIKYYKLHPYQKRLLKTLYKTKSLRKQSEMIVKAYELISGSAHWK